MYYEETLTIDLSKHNLVKEIDSLMASSWTHVHITDQTLTMFGKIYNLKNKLNTVMRVPHSYFGENRISYSGESKSIYNNQLNNIHD